MLTVSSWVNATQILKVAGVIKSQRTKTLEKEIQVGLHEKVQGGCEWHRFELMGTADILWLQTGNIKALGERPVLDCQDELTLDPGSHLVVVASWQNNTVYLLTSHQSSNSVQIPLVSLRSPSHDPRRPVAKEQRHLQASGALRAHLS